MKKLEYKRPALVTYPRDGVSGYIMNRVICLSSPGFGSPGRAGRNIEEASEHEL